RVPRRWSIVLSSPSEMKIQASASGSRSATMPPASCERRMTSATNSCTSRTCRLRARRVSGSAPASAGARIQRATEPDRAAARLEVRPSDRPQPVLRVVLALEGLFPERPYLLPDPVEAGEVELTLRREVTVEHRLGDAGLACDLRCRRPAVAALRENPAGRF